MKNTNLILAILLIIFLAMSGSLFAANNCLEFDGTDDYVEIPADPSQNITDAITIEAWVKPGSADHYQNILEKGSYYDDAYALLVKQDIQYIKFSLMGIDQHWGYGPVNLWDGKWHHIAGTYDKNGGSNNTNLYVDGYCVKSETKTGSITSDPSRKIYIGGHSYDGNLFNGSIDEVRLWNVARTEAEIRANMYREIPNSTSEANLVAYYQFNETSDINLPDESSNSNDGTLNNMVGNEWQTSPAFAGPKNCLDFDGTDDYVEVADDASLYQNNTITVSAWIYPRNINVWGWKRIIEKNDWGKDGWTFFHSLFYNPELHVDIDGDNVNSNQIISENQWQHIAFTYNSTYLKIYYNGEEVYSAPKSYTLYSANPLSIGHANGAGDYFNGIIDEICIWNTALTAQQIRENMCKTLVGNESGLIAYYNFDNTSGTTLQDFSGNTNDGTLQNMDNADWVNSSAFNTWLNTNSSDWSTAANWSRGSVPTSTDNVGIVDYMGGTAPILSGSPTLNNLVVDDTFTLTSGVTINNQLIIESDLDLNGQTVTLGSSANLIESSGHLTGTTGTIQTTRNLSNINEDVAGLGAKITTSANMGSTTIIRGHEAQGTLGIKRYYQINPITNTGLNATLVFNYLDAELNGVTETDLKLFKSADGDSWTEQSLSTVNTTDNTLTLTGIDSFSWWTGGETGSGSMLPVNLSSFYALYTSGTPTLYWTTQSETDNAYWNVYRGTSDSFEAASHINANNPVPGNGTTNNASDYIFTDTTPVVQNTTYWYWIEDVSTDGKTEVHEPVTLFIPFEDTPVTPEDYGLHQNYPNPFNPSTSISFALSEDSDVELIIYNVKGAKIRTIFNEHIYADQITTAVWDGKDINGKQVSSGVYFYKLITNTTEYQKKMLMVK